MARKAIPAQLNPRNYPSPRVWHNGYVSKAQARKFDRTAKLRKFAAGMLANTPGGATRASRLSKLPQRVRRKKRK